MARRARIHYPGAVYHVVVRGNGGRDIFYDDSGRIRFYELLEEGVERFHVRIPALCLMSNHTHLFVQLADIALSRLIQNVSFRYTRYRNAIVGRATRLPVEDLDIHITHEKLLEPMDAVKLDQGTTPGKVGRVSTCRTSGELNDPGKAGGLPFFGHYGTTWRRGAGNCRGRAMTTFR